MEGSLNRPGLQLFLILLTSELFLSLWVSPLTWQPKGKTEPWKRSDCPERVLEKPSMGKASELSNWSLGSVAVPMSLAKPELVKEAGLLELQVTLKKEFSCKFSGQTECK